MLVDQAIDRPIDRSTERSSDVSSDPTTERSSDLAIDRPNDRAIYPHRATERLSDRYELEHSNLLFRPLHAQSCTNKHIIQRAGGMRGAIRMKPDSANLLLIRRGLGLEPCRPTNDHMIKPSLPDPPSHTHVDHLAGTTRQSMQGGGGGDQE